jgi:A/G-specific adenine glycosylase
LTSFAGLLLAWYAHYRRDLPWRENQDPYKVWLSEVILQQTRIEQGKAYFIKFVELFPDVHHLAKASEDEVLKAWQGLGYYSRARNLHATAQIVSRDMHGVFPRSAQDLHRLKGVGEYTAAAIASICYDEAVPVIDGNVMRVLSRVFGIDEPVDSPQGKKVIKGLAEEHLKGSKPSVYNQAIMDLGAMQCVPSNPDCLNCPLAALCVAKQSGRANQLPVKKQKIKVQEVFMLHLVVHDHANVWLIKRPESGIWGGLYDFPTIVLENLKNAEDEALRWIEKRGLKTAQIDFSEEYVHLLTHRRIRTIFVAVQVKKLKTCDDPHILRILKRDFHRYGIPRLTEKYIERSHIIPE